MTSLNISLPEQLKQYVEDRVAEGDYGTPSEYVRDLIRHDREQARTAPERQLLAALDSPGIEISEEELRGGAFVNVLRKRLSQSSLK